MKGVVAELDGLIIQATTERSHYYVKAVATKARTAIIELRKENEKLRRDLERHHDTDNEGLTGFVGTFD